MKDFLLRHIEFTEEEYDLFISMAKLKQYKKNENLFHANTSFDKLLFIKQGFIRGYRLINGVDITHHFYLENWFATDYESFLTGKPGELHMESMTSSWVYEFSKKTLFSFFEEHPKFEKIRIILAEYAYLQMTEKFRNIQTKDLKERYRNLIDKNPALFNLVAQKHIASYLGVAPQSLSRIKSLVKHS